MNKRKALTLSDLDHQLEEHSSQLKKLKSQEEFLNQLQEWFDALQNWNHQERITQLDLPEATTFDPDKKAIYSNLDNSLIYYYTDIDNLSFQSLDGTTLLNVHDKEVWPFTDPMTGICFPNDVWFLIFQQLDGVTLFKFRRVCRHFKTTIEGLKRWSEISGLPGTWLGFEGNGFPYILKHIVPILKVRGFLSLMRIHRNKFWNEHLIYYIVRLHCKALSGRTATVRLPYVGSKALSVIISYDRIQKYWIELSSWRSKEIRLTGDGKDLFFSVSDFIYPLRYILENGSYSTESSLFYKEKVREHLPYIKNRLRIN